MGFRIGCGDTIGGITVVSPVEEKNSRPDGKKHSRANWTWLCKCTKCGKLRTYRHESLRDRAPEDCGCSLRVYPDRLFTGEKFGKFTVTGLVSNQDFTMSNGEKKYPHNIIYNCICECGSVVTRTCGYLVDNKNKEIDCGCLLSGYPLILESGTVFGKLTVIHLKSIAVSKNRFSEYLYLCECECGKEKVYSKIALTSGNAVTCGASHHFADRAKKNFSKNNKIEVCGNLLKVYFTNYPCEFCIIDTEDYTKIMEYTWFLSTSGYASNKSGELKSIHGILNKPPSGFVTDHKNRNKLDNRKCNLRSCTNEQNLQNKHISVRNTSGYLGVSMGTSKGKYCTSIKGKLLGYFDDVIVAHNCYRENNIKVYGEFSPYNHPYKTLETILTESGFPHKEKT